jgi:hypothetical protein
MKAHIGQLQRNRRLPLDNSYKSRGKKAATITRANPTTGADSPIYARKNRAGAKESSPPARKQYSPHNGQGMQMPYSSSSSFTRSRSSLPGLKCGTNLPSKRTDWPVLGLRPTRGAR